MAGTDFNSSDPFALGHRSRGSMHSSPYFNQSQLYSPKRLKELFKWCEYLFYNSAHIYAALRKFGEYPITEVIYDTVNESLKNKHEFLLEKVIHARQIMIEMTLDKYVYGNAFISMYQPFVRFLKCPKCSNLTNIKNIDYTFSYQKLQFSYDCKSCNKSVRIGEKGVVDRKLSLSRKINFIRWDPKAMDIDHNPMSGGSVYYYTIPKDVSQRVQAGHKHLIDTLPMGFLAAIKRGKQFKFADNAVYHMKVGGPAGINPQWGLPPLLAALQMFHYTAILRKANEAIALDHIVPFRIVHPAQASGVADPVTTISLENWKDNLKSHFQQWRKDPLHMMFAPIPVGVTQIGGQGRALLTLGEVQEAEKNIVAALGIPIEFLYGGLTKSGMEATLRLIENQLETHINDLKDLLQWVDDSCAKFLGWDQIQVDMTPFRMVDDYSHKQTVMQLYMQGKQTGDEIISDALMAEINKIDLQQEEGRIKQEKLDRVRRHQDLQLEIKKLEQNLATQAQAEAQEGAQQGYGDQQHVISEADEVVEYLQSLDPGMRKSHLSALSKEDYVLYCVVIQRLEQNQTTAKAEATSGM